MANREVSNIAVKQFENPSFGPPSREWTPVLDGTDTEYWFR